MTRLPTQRLWSLIGWLPGWSRWERLGIALPLAAAVLASWFSVPPRPWLEGGLFFLAFVAFNVVVHRHGGWGLLGPHYYYDVVRLARRGRSTVLRVVYIAGVFLGLWLVYHGMPDADSMHVNDFAAAAQRFAFALFQVQNLAVLVLTPAYLGSAIAEERERRTLELLFTTQLSDKEIILGKLFARIIHLVGFVLAGAPILCLIQFWGGIDMLLIAGNLANTLLLILSVGSFCLLFSTLMRSVTAAVLTAYALLAPTAFGCSAALQGFPFVLQDARSASGRMITVQDLPVLVIVHATVASACLALAWMTLRGRDYFDVASLPERVPDGLLRQEIAAAVVVMPRPAHNYEPGAEDVFAVPYVLPPIGVHPLLWKERYVGGPPLMFSPIMLVPMVPFLLTGSAILAFWGAMALYFESDRDLERSRHLWTMVLRFIYYVFLACYVLGVSFRAAASVARERQQQTLEPLLLLPIDRRDILIAKWLASVIRGWPWLAMILADILLGLWLGAFHPGTAILLCLAPWPMIAFFTSFGLLLSVLMSTVLRAYLAMVVVLVMLTGCTMFGLPVLSYADAFAVPTPLPEVAPAWVIGLGLSAMAGYAVLAAVCWFMAVRQFDDRGRRA